MDRKRLDRMLLCWNGVSSDVKWGDDLVYSVGDKMFAVYCLRGKQAGSLSFKVEDERFLELTELTGVEPAPYLARARWIMLVDSKLFPRPELEQLLRRSYALVAARLTRKLRQALGIEV
jgi:predicted DNA-binding protein (MmcQ/YjbR family)